MTHPTTALTTTALAPTDLTRRTHLFELRLARYTTAGGGDVRVLGFRGVEATNALYRFRVRVAVPLADASTFAAAAPEATATLALHADAGTRFVHGIVGALTTRDVATGSHAVFDLRIVPRLERLRHTRRTRIFQDKTTPEILALVLNERAIRHRWRLQRAYEKRAYTTQYGESDLAFVQRLAAEEGVFTFFDHPSAAGPDDATGLGDCEVLVFADTADAVSPIEGIPSLQHRVADVTGGMTQDEHQVHDFTSRQALRTKGVFFRAFSHETPLLEHRDLASPQIVGASVAREPRDPGRIHLTHGLTEYEHLGPREETRTLPLQATIALEQARHGALRAQGRSACRRLVPGRTFRLIDHDVSALNDEYTVTRVTHEGHAPDVALRSVGGERSAPTYANTFEVVPRATPARPKRPAARPTASHETAIVVGPPGQEVHTDALGRVKVQFHWDLDGKRDDKSSCWLRVTQAWAGAGFGAQFIPRVGMEVLVAFLGGDPDRPVVTGCLYNAVNRPPFSTRDEIGQSGVRTQALDGRASRGSEIVFDDSAAKERVHVLSQGLLDLTSARQARIDAGGDLSLVTAGRRIDTSGGDFESAIGGRQVLTIGGDARATYGGSRVEHTQGDLTEKVMANASHHVGGRFTKHIGQSATVLIGNASRESFGFVQSSGPLGVRAASRCDVTAEEGIEMRVGERSAIRIERDAIILRAPQVIIDAPRASIRHPEGRFSFGFGPDIAIQGSSVTLTSAGASLVLDAEAKLDGALVKLNCGGVTALANAAGRAGQSGAAIFELCPLPPDLATVPVVLGIRLPDGEVEEHTVDASGRVVVEGAPGDRFVLVFARRGDAPLALSQVRSSDAGDH